MQDFENLVMLMCAAVASMGVGVLVAYLVCKVGFGLMQWHADLQIAQREPQGQTQVARVS